MEGNWIEGIIEMRQKDQQKQDYGVTTNLSV